MCRLLFHSIFIHDTAPHQPPTRLPAHQQPVARKQPAAGSVQPRLRPSRTIGTQRTRTRFGIARHPYAIRPIKYLLVRQRRTQNPAPCRMGEILLKLTAREDPHPNLYHALAQLMRHFGTGQHHLAPLRHFEWQLLHELGYAPSAQHDQQQQPIETHANYLMQPEASAERIAEAESSLHSMPNSCIISGDVLQALETSSLQPHQLKAALTLNRLLIQHYLPEGIISRQALHQLQQMKQKLSSAIST